MTPESVKRVAEANLRKAQLRQHSEATRADIAFEAVYMWCRYIMAGREEGLRHPQASVLRGTAELLGWPECSIATALTHLDFRETHERLARPESPTEALLSRSTREALVDIALKLKAAADN